MSRPDTALATTLPLPGLRVHRLSLAASSSGGDAEAEWIAASRRGDHSAFAALVQRHERRVFRLAGRFFDPSETEDVAQETFLTAWQKLDSYAAKAPFEHWLTRICLNLCYARLRRNRPTTELPAEQPAASLAASADPSDAHRLDAQLDAERLLARLAPADRFLLKLLHGEGWSVAEIAERTGWSSANVKVRAFRARRRLRRMIEGGADDAPTPAEATP